MTAHIVFPALDPERRPATMSAPILNGILRERWAYQGLVISDSLIMGAIADHYGPGDAAVAAVRAGCDLLLAFGSDARQDDVLDRLAVTIERGDIPGAQVAASLARADGASERWGVGAAPARDLSAAVGTEEHLGIARRIAEASVTLVRDRASVIPLAGRLGVVTVETDGQEPPTPSLAPVLRHHHAEVIEARAGTSFDGSGLDDADRLVAVTCARGALPAAQVAVVQGLHRRYGDRLVVVATGDPYDLLQFPEVPAYLLTYGPDEPSLDAAARVLLGLLPPRGQLPVALPGLYAAGHSAPVTESTTS
jgi:beta-N-acetylhexosaminidase